MMMMGRGGGARVANTALTVAATRLFSTASTARGGAAAVAAVGREPVVVAAAKGLGGGEVGGAPNKLGYWVRAPLGHVSGVRNGSTLALSEKENNEEKKVGSSSESGAVAGGNKENEGVVSYWGIQPSKITKEDGTEWKWNCFRVCMYICMFIVYFVIFCLFCIALF